MVPLILAAESVPDFQSYCPVVYVHVWEEGNVLFTAKICFYEWDSFILLLRTDCISHQTGHKSFHVSLNFNIIILIQSFVLEMLPKKKKYAN